MKVLLLLASALICGALTSTSSASAADSCAGSASAGLNSWNSAVTCSEPAGATADTAPAVTGSNASTTTYVYDALCQANDGIVQDTAYGCAGQFQCGDDGVLHDVTAIDASGTHTGLGAYCVEPGDPASATAPVLTPGRILEAFRRIPLPDAPLEIQPPGGETLVNFDTILHTQAEPFQETVQLLGRQITFDITPATFTWTLGNGQTMTTTDPGQPNRDRYGRMLRYVDRVDQPGEPDHAGEVDEASPVDVARELLATGAARRYETRPALARESTYTTATTAARSASRGLWGHC